MSYAHKLFLPFERLVTESEYPGTGIGLTSALKIVQRHRGTIWAEGVPGKGATFYFTLHEN
jgi:light-regulated signal transduction histidine kinase (bacteriophytochrome)